MEVLGTNGQLFCARCFADHRRGVIISYHTMRATWTAKNEANLSPSTLEFLKTLMSRLFPSPMVTCKVTGPLGIGEEAADGDHGKHHPEYAKGDVLRGAVT